MAETIYLDYEIHLTDEAEVLALQAANSRFVYPHNDPAATTIMERTSGALGQGYLFCSPTLAATLYEGDVVANGGATVDSPKVTSIWIKDLAQTSHPYDVHEFDAPSGQPWKWDPGPNRKHVWRGRFIFSPNVRADVTDETEADPIRQRRFIEGFEWVNGGAGGASQATGVKVSREASRHVDGFGLFLTGHSAGVRRNVDDHGATLTEDSWERFYMRVVETPTAEVDIWRTHGATSGSAGIVLTLLPTLQVAIYNCNSSNVRTLVATADPVTLDDWYCIDNVFEYGATAYFRLFYNKVQKVNVVSFPSGVGLGQVQNHSGSTIGQGASDASANVGIHFDDWHNAIVPLTFTGLDFLVGSRIMRADVTAIASAVNWTPADQPGWLLNNPPVEAESSFSVATSTASAELNVTLDHDVFRREPHCIGGGIVAAVFGFYGTRNGTGDGTLGHNVNGAGWVDEAVVGQATARKWHANVAYFPAGLELPELMESLAMRHIASSGASAATVTAMACSVQVLGIFGEEDNLPPPNGQPTTPPPTAGTHMNPFGHTPWSLAVTTAPVSPVLIRGALYSGNDLETVLNFRVPPTFIYARRVTATVVSSTVWWSSKQGPNAGFEQPVSTAAGVRIEQDPSFVISDEQNNNYRVRLIGDTTPINDVAASYQYIAFCDPGMRFNLNGIIRHHTGSVDKTTNIWKPTFLPEALFLHQLTTGGSTAVAMYHKGPGSATDAVSPLNATALASRVAMAEGAITTSSAFHSTFTEIAWSAWRADDGSGDAGIPGVVKIFTYTGDGSASRTINLAPASGKRPLFAIISPANAASILRDPSHTGTTSSAVSTGQSLTANASTGITGGGIDQINVGSVLNGNGIVYNVFVIMGGETAGENGWSANGETEPVEPIAPADWPGADLPDDEEADFPEEGGGGGDPGEPDPGDTGDSPGGEDFGDQCLSASQKVCNQALAFIGITQSMTNVATQNTPEALMSRLFYSDAVNEALRDYPWPFATRYVALTLLAGTATAPVNDDWQYAYQVPSDMLYARRVVNVADLKKRAVDREPPEFRTGTTVIGSTITHVIFSDEADAVLEYTYRPTCAAGRGDSIFRSALAWLMAHKLAPGLSRNKVTAENAYQLYLAQLARAKVVAQRESQPNPDASAGASWIDGR